MGDEKGVIMLNPFVRNTVIVMIIFSILFCFVLFYQKDGNTSAKERIYIYSDFLTLKDRIDILEYKVDSLQTALYNYQFLQEGKNDLNEMKHLYLEALIKKGE